MQSCCKTSHKAVITQPFTCHLLCQEEKKEEDKLSTQSAHVILENAATNLVYKVPRGTSDYYKKM